MLGPRRNRAKISTDAPAIPARGTRCRRWSRLHSCPARIRRTRATQPLRSATPAAISTQVRAAQTLRLTSTPRRLPVLATAHAGPAAAPLPAALPSTRNVERICVRIRLAKARAFPAAPVPGEGASFFAASRAAEHAAQGDAALFAYMLQAIPTDSSCSLLAGAMPVQHSAICNVASSSRPAAPNTSPTTHSSQRSSSTAPSDSSIPAQTAPAHSTLLAPTAGARVSPATAAALISATALAFHTAAALLLRSKPLSLLTGAFPAPPSGPPSRGAAAFERAASISTTTGAPVRRRLILAAALLFNSLRRERGRSCAHPPPQSVRSLCRLVGYFVSYV